ncbi:hypothetical protein CMV30_05520 [Nibricoccus aquaticus]|uniref:TIGR02597 family protein n=1 Tax=Nibricoccus aquaticus TaxID=2576891 RepID=A0A290Q4N9_9BACT|nr:hypothetical protein [Nibricoccus aquaticus]ATC63454.1 hypothetical protein CMV30_05520 [Nibricoccus aquaticus]
MTTHRITLLAAFCAAALSAQAGTTVTSAPYGAMTSSIATSTAGLAFPLSSDVFAGRISANSASTLTFETTGLAAALTTGEKYYVEIVSGPLEGERFDLNTATTISSGTATLDLAAASNSTSNTLLVDVLAQARAVVRPHVTLAKLGAMFSPALVGNAANAQADGVRIYGGPTGQTTYYLRTDGTWRSSPTSADQSALVIAPDTSVIVVLRSGSKQWSHLGAVRTNVFRKKLKTGIQSFATGFPLDLSAVQIGAFVDPLEASTIRWTGADVSAQADTLRVHDSASDTYKINYLRADGASWYLTGGSTDISATPFLPAQGALLVGRQKADAGYLIIRPFSL